MAPAKPRPLGLSVIWPITVEESSPAPCRTYTRDGRQHACGSCAKNGVPQMTVHDFGKR